jgi:creatinine amidohydrolase
MTHTELAACQLELLRPHEIRDRLAERSIVYLPLGAIEWHCEHLPVGLDALTAHGICLRAAARDGGIVYPPLHYGTGGGHGGYPWTVMMPGASEIEGMLLHTFTRLEAFGIRLGVLFTGHFADEQIAMTKRICAKWNAAEHTTKALALSINEVKDAPLAPDHAGIFETTLLGALWPARVDIGRLPARDPHESGDDPWSEKRHDPKHPLWGIIGPDPRGHNFADGPILLSACLDWVLSEVEAALPR